MIQMRLPIVFALLVYSILMRLLPYILARFGMDIDPATTHYPWNFSPLLAIGLFGGACFADRRWALAIPLGAFLVGDLGIWAITGKAEWAFYATQPVVYACIAVTVFLGTWLRQRRSVPAIAGTGLGAAVLFFVVTNFAVWALGDGTIYPRTPAGLAQCYTMAIPFFRNSLISMAVFSAILFSPIVLAAREVSESSSRPVALTE